MRVLSDGAYVTETPFNIASASNADPGVFSAPGNAFEVHDWVYLTALEGMVEVDNNIYKIASIPSTGSFTLSSTLDNSDIDTTDFGIYTTGGTVGRIFTLETPYLIADVAALKWTQSADVMTLTHPSYVPRDLARIAADNWTLTETTFGTSITAPVTTSATATNTTGSSESTAYSYVVTSVDALTGQESIASPIASVTNSVDIAETLGALNIAWSAVTGAEYYNIYKAPPAFGSTVPVGSLFGYAGTSFGLTFNDSNILQDMSVVPPQHFDPFATAGIDYFTVTATGSGYTNTSVPTVVITDPTGTGAVGEAVIDGDGLTAVIVQQSGQDYTSPTVQIISGSAGSGADIEPVGGFEDFWHGTVNIVSGGSGYVSPVVVAKFGSHQYSPTTLSVTGGVIASCVFADPPIEVPASLVTISVTDSAGSGAEATAHISATSGTYPSCVAYFQQRRFYANTVNNPDTYFASQPGAFTNMDRSIPVIDTDAIVGTPWAQQVNGIQAMVPMPGGLVILTGLGAWQLSGGSQGSAVTPSNQVATAQAYNGCSPLIRPITINYDILYVQEKGSVVRDLSYNFFVNIYTGTDLTVLANHLFDDHLIVRWDWAEEPYKLLWAVRDDGILLCLTYLKEQEVYAWTRHDTEGLFTSVCAVSEPPVNAVYFIVRRRIQNGDDPQWVYYTERLDNRLWTNIEAAWCVDSGLSYGQDAPDATLNVESATGDKNIELYNIIDGGNGYTAPVGTIVDLVENGGSGATVLLGLTGGHITSATPVDIGDSYIRPVMRITDATGVGAKIQPIVTNYTNYHTDVSFFTADHVGDIIRSGGGQAVVVEFHTATRVTANIQVPIAETIGNDPDGKPIPQPSGNWTIATLVTVLHGLNHLEGMDVSCLADGGVVNNLTVENGSVTLPIPASSIVVGLGYRCELQTLPLEAPAGVTIQGRRKNIFQANIRVEDSAAPLVGTNQPDQSTQANDEPVDWANMVRIPSRGPQNLAGLPIQLFTGEWFTGVLGDWDTPGQLAIQMSNPLPVTVLSVIPWLQVGDTPSQ